MGRVEVHPKAWVKRGKQSLNKNETKKLWKMLECQNVTTTRMDRRKFYLNKSNGYANYMKATL